MPDIIPSRGRKKGALLPGAMLEEKVKNPERKLWNFYDYHFSPAGHQVVAHEVVDFLKENFLKRTGTRR